MNLLRRFMKALHDDRVRAHKRWLRRNRVLMPKPHSDERNWQGQFTESLK